MGLNNALVLIFPLLAYTQFETFFKNDSMLSLSDFVSAFVFYVVYHIFFAILSLKKTNNVFVYNWKLFFLFTMTTFFIMNVIFCFDFFYYIFPLSVSCLIFSHFLWLLLSFRSYLIHKSHKSVLEMFFVGTETRPVLFGNLDLKMYLNRTTSITPILLDVMLLWNHIVALESLNKTLLILFALRFLYHVDGLVNEHAFETSFEIQTEKFGYQISIAYLIHPFLLQISVYQIYLKKIEFEIWKLLLIVMCGTFGFIIYRLSNDQMYKFRTNPIEFSDSETIATHIKGKKLLCSGLWGVVRHPNYLGDIFVWLGFSGFTLWTPSIFMYMDIIFLVHRAYRNNKICKEKYGEAWDKYCQKVKYLLIPGIY